MQCRACSYNGDRVYYCRRVSESRARSPGVPTRDPEVQPLDGLRIRAHELPVQAALHHDHWTAHVIEGRSRNGGIRIPQQP